ncbi:hypothetical protein SNE40_011170 [Patella caerulea]|uniref:Retrotransposon gag domain-containing protein n=1 Tax=Patella caerulea TaxID=87958 RepID=A0AAN8JNK2_PATCE
MAVASFRKVEPFSEECDDFQLYVEKLEQYFLANDIEGEEEMKSVFLSNIGAKTYKLSRNLVSPTKLADKSYDSLFEALMNHYSPRPSEIVQRAKFNTRVRHEGESIANYVADLRQVSNDCNFGPTLDIV